MPVARFEIVDCQRNHLEHVEIPVPENFNEIDYRHDALTAAGYDGSIVCDGCYDTAYRAEFVKLV